jgi:hypothetical protein
VAARGVAALDRIADTLSRGSWRIVSPERNTGCFHLRKSGSSIGKS